MRSAIAEICWRPSLRPRFMECLTKLNAHRHARRNVLLVCRVHPAANGVLCECSWLKIIANLRKC